MSEKLTLPELYKELKNGNEEINVSPLTKDLLVLSFKYGYLKKKPSKKHRKWWKKAFQCEYPEYASDIPKSAVKKLKKFIQRSQEDERLEEKWGRQRAKRGYSDNDAWNISSWFLDVMPKMLRQMRNNLHGCPTGVSAPMNNSQAVVLTDEEKESLPMKKWEETLDRMIFLLGEMNEDTCSYVNPYKKEHDKMNEDFRKKYGWSGEKLKSDTEKEEEKKKGHSRMYFPHDFPELYPQARELDHDYFMHEQYKQFYMDKCREEFFGLFSRHFWDLWD